MLVGMLASVVHWETLPPERIPTHALPFTHRKLSVERPEQDAPDPRTLSGRIRLYRKKFGLLQKDLAKQVGVSANTVRNWELGHSKPSPQNLQRLAEMVKVPQRFLLVSEAEFPHRFLLTRRRLALSQGEIASRLDVTRDTISNWERGESEPRGATRERVDQLIEATLHGGESVAARVWELRMRLGMSQS